MATQFHIVLDELNLIREKLERAHDQEVRCLQDEIRYWQHLNPSGSSERKKGSTSLGVTCFDAAPSAEHGGRVSQGSSVATHARPLPPSGRSSRNSLPYLAPLQEQEEEGEEEKEVSTDEKQNELDIAWQEKRSSNNPSTAPAPAPDPAEVKEGAAIARRSKPLGRPPRAASAQAEQKESSQIERTLSTFEADMAAVEVSNQQCPQEAAAQACISDAEARENPRALLHANANTNISDTLPTPFPSPPDIHRFSQASYASLRSYALQGVGSERFATSRPDTKATLLSSEGRGVFLPKEPWSIKIPRLSDGPDRVTSIGQVWVNKVPSLGRLSRQLGRSHTRPSLSGGLLLNPFSTQRFAWDLFGLMLIFYDSLFIPLQLLEVEDPVSDLVWVSRVFWTLDIFIQSVTAVIVEQRMVRDFRETFKSYAKGWLVFDFGVVFVDWLTLAAESDKFGDAADTLRTLRILRFIRLVRLARIRRVWREVVARINNAAIVLMIGIVRHIIVLMIVNHIIACLWYGVGRASKSWNYEVGLHDSTVLYRYLSALHWSVTQFHGSVDIHPVNEPERAFAVCMVFVALVGFSSFLSILTNKMMQLQQLKSERTRLQQTLCVYLKERKISPQLSARVKKHVGEDINLDKKRQAMFDAVSLLPRHLLVDLYEEARSPMLLKHPLLQGISFLYPRMVRDICYLAAEEVVMDSEDIIFVVSDVCTSMLHVKSGTLKYHLERVSGDVAPHKDGRDATDEITRSGSNVGTLNKRLSLNINVKLEGNGDGRSSRRFSLVTDEFANAPSMQSKQAAVSGAGQDSLGRSSLPARISQGSAGTSEMPTLPRHVNKGQWISEAIMWTHWEYCGELHCVSAGELIALHAEKFGNVVRRYNQAVLQVASYAREFIENLNDSKQCNDIDGPVMAKQEKHYRDPTTQRDTNHVAKIFRQLTRRAMPSL